MSSAYFRISRDAGALPELDGMRALAILLVLGRHAVRDWEAHRPGQLGAVGPLTNGWMGVDLFFVLSGFLITWHLVKRTDEGMKVGRYLAKRALRIVPAYYAVLLLAASGLLWFYDVPSSKPWVAVAYHLLFLQDYLKASIVVAFWSLGVEEKFYLLAPFVLLPLARRRNPWPALGLLFLVPLAGRVATWLAHPEMHTYDVCFWIQRSPFHLAVDGMVAGATCAFARRLRPACAITHTRALGLAGAAVVGVLALHPDLLGTIRLWNSTVLFSVLALGFAAILWAQVAGAPWRWLAWGGWVVWAKLSYALYLVHMLFLDLAWGLADWPDGWPGFVMFSAIWVGISVLAAAVLHFLVEKPFLIVKEHL